VIVRAVTKYSKGQNLRHNHPRNERAKDTTSLERLNTPISRRKVLAGGAALGLGTVLGKSGLTSRQGRLIESALASSSSGSIGDIEHIVILMQENRSFDHYYGTLPGVRGFNDTVAYRSYARGPATDPSTVFTQTMVNGSDVLYQLADGATSLQPFELVSDPPTVDGQTTNDITHDWGPQHLAWNNGSMNQFAVQHLIWDGAAPWQLGPHPGPDDRPQRDHDHGLLPQCGLPDVLPRPGRRLHDL
jgi:Phosphoesterase family